MSSIKIHSSVSGERNTLMSQFKMLMSLLHRYEYVTTDMFRSAGIKNPAQTVQLAKESHGYNIVGSWNEYGEYCYHLKSNVSDDDSERIEHRKSKLLNSIAPIITQSLEKVITDNMPLQLTLNLALLPSTDRIASTSRNIGGVYDE